LILFSNAALISLQSLNINNFFDSLDSFKRFGIQILWE
ncbi:MAG: hypothetical protein ACI9UT_002302, partial [Flavobacteriales bacterium]